MQCTNARFYFNNQSMNVLESFAFLVNACWSCNFGTTPLGQLMQGYLGIGRNLKKKTSSTQWDVNLSAKKLMAFIAAAVHGSSIASYYLQLRLLKVWDLVNPYGVNAKLLANCL